MEFLTESPLFGILLCLLAFEIGMFIYKKTNFPLFNPLLIAIMFVIITLLAFNIDYDTFNKGGQFINMFLGPATVVLAVPLYKQLELLKKYPIPIILGILFGSLIGIISIVVLCLLFGLDEQMLVTLLPKSVTTPIGMEISKSLDGIVPLTVISIIVTGIFGAVIGPLVCKVFKIKNKIAIGIALGTAAHAVGTSRALELGEVEGAMSSLSIGIAGLLTVFLAPIIYNISIYLLNIIGW